MHRYPQHRIILMALILIVWMHRDLVQPQADEYVVRFSDSTISLMQHATLVPVPATGTKVSAHSWLKRNGWQKVWPRFGFGKAQPLFFDGSPSDRYLRIDSEATFFIWSRKLDIDPHERPLLEIKWGMDRFPERAALDVYGRHDRPLVVLISFGPKVPSSGLLPNVPRGLAFFWGETETVGTNYTCRQSRRQASKKLLCKYPHVKYIALRSGSAGTSHTDRVHLVEAFQRHFPTYWDTHRKVPPIVAVSFEAHLRHTESVSRARLYTITFTDTTSTKTQ